MRREFAESRSARPLPASRPGIFRGDGGTSRDRRNSLARDPFVSPRVTGRELRYEWRANLLKQAGSIDEVITRAGHFIPTARGLLPNRSISSRVFATR